MFKNVASFPVATLPEIILIFAVDENGVMGKDGKMPWHSPHDFHWFKTTTDKSTIVMGRKTWESLPKKPLPYRKNIVLSRKMDFEAEGAISAISISNALSHHAVDNQTNKVFVIGGKEVLEKASSVAKLAYVTHIGVKTPIDETCVMGPNLPEHRVIETIKLYEGDSEYPSAYVEVLEFISKPGK